MIEDLDDRLLAWAREASGVPAVLGPPQPVVGGEGVAVHLLDVRPAPPDRSRTPPPLQAWVRYLVTVSAADTPSAHRLLGKLTLAALQREDLELVDERPDGAMWAAFGVPPGPSLTIRTLLRVERTVPAAPAVRQPLLVQPATMRPLAGAVVGPGDQPLMGARVGVPGSPDAVYTDTAGRFRLAGVLVPRPDRLLVSVKGRSFVVPLEAEGTDVLVRVDPLED